MRNGFGRFAEQLRCNRRMSLSEFARSSGMSMSRVCNIESQRTNISDDVVREYLRILKCTGVEAVELRKRAVFSNTVRHQTSEDPNISPLQAMMDQFGDKVSPEALAKIQEILERETGEKIAALAFSSNKISVSKGAPLTRKQQRPSLTPRRFAEIACWALDVRRQFGRDTEKLNVERVLQNTMLASKEFDYVILEAMPSFLEGAFAAICGHSHGHTILLEEGRYRSALNGVHFARHAICHELGHHYLHSKQLQNDEVLFLAPQNLAKNSCEMVGTSKQIAQVIDSVEEAEAECFATLFLVPWESFLKGTENVYLSDDYGEQLVEVKRYRRYFNVPPVVDALRDEVWKRGCKIHPVFDFIPTKFG